MATVPTYKIVLNSKNKLTQAETLLEVSSGGVNIKSLYNSILNAISFGSTGLKGNVDFSSSPGFDNNSFVQKKYTDLQHSYSTTETKTGGTWIDGKPIYRKVFTGITESSNITTWIYMDDLNIDYLISYNGMINAGGNPNDFTNIFNKSSSGNTLFTLFSKSGGTAIALDPKGNSIYYSKGYSIIVEYTKTTG